jgi:protein HIRA/HIR1
MPGKCRLNLASYAKRQHPLSYRNLKTKKALFPQVAIQSIIPTSNKTDPQHTPTSIKQAIIRPNGTPWIQLSSGTCYAYNSDFQAWEELCNSWLAESSPIWTRTRGGASGTLVTGMEADLNNLQPDLVQDLAQDKPRWWNDALTLGHLETRMRAAALLDSAAEYKPFLLMYAKKIAEEGYKSNGEELARELYGPVY